MQLEIEGYQIEVQARANPFAKGVKLHINRSRLIVTSRSKLTQSRIKQLIHQNKDWVVAQIDKLTNTALSDGRIINVLGEEFTVRLTLSPDAKINERDGEFIVTAPSQVSGQKLLSDYLKSKYAKLVKLRAAELAQIHNFSYKGITMRDQSSRWGSCSRSKNLNFNWRLIFAPVEVMDYVIIHEFCHTEVFNHSPKFWQLVETHMPQYKKHSMWLKRHGSELLEF